MLLGTRFCLIALLMLSISPSQLNAAKAEAELIVDLNSPNASTVANTIEKLGHQYPASTNAHAAIRPLLADPRPTVRRRAARILGYCRAIVDDNDVRNICQLFQSTDMSEIEDGLKALRTLVAPQATPLILPLLQFHHPGIIRDACRTLAEMGTEEAIPAIQPLTNHPDKNVRADAQRAVTRLRVRAAASPGSPVEARRRTSSGTGFVVANGGYILTCAHVVGNSTSVTVRATSGDIYVASVIASDPANDLCLLLAPAVTNSAIQTVEAYSVVVGQAVYCLGYPLEGGIVNNVSPVVGNGVVASLRGLEGDTRHLQVTVAMNPGNSGGPIFDESGRWIGVAAHKLADLYSLRKTGQLPQGFNFAVKSALAVTLFDTVPGAKLAVGLKTEKVPLEELVKRLSKSVVCVIAR